MSIGLKGNVDGSGAIQVGGSDAITISTGLVVTGSAGNLMLQSGTAVASTSGTSIDFTGIPSWAKRVTVMLAGVSTSGTSGLLLQLGTSSGIENSGYVGVGTSTDSAAVVSTSFTAGFGVARNTLATNTHNGFATIVNINANIWAANGINSVNASVQYYVSGAKTLTGTLDRVRIATVNGTDTFDAGTINILWE